MIRFLPFAFILSLFYFNCNQLIGQTSCAAIASYPFSGNANDVSGNGLNGTAYNATLTANQNGVANSAYSFDGSTSYIDLGNNALLKRYATNFSISAWVYLNSYSSTYLSAIVSNRNTNNLGSVLGIGGSLQNQGKVELTVEGGASSSEATSNTVLALNKWYFITATYIYTGNNTDTAKIYVNGILETTTVINDVLDPQTTDTYIGFEPSSLSPSTYHFNGIIDEVNIYNCVLDQQQIANSYVPATSVITTATQSSIQSSSINIFPNPGNGIFNVSNVPSGALYEVYSMSGIQSGTGTLSSLMDLSNLPKGLYLLKIINSDNTVNSQKLVID
jgi:hypothetical protein